MHGFHMESLLKPQEQTTIVRTILYLAVYAVLFVSRCSCGTKAEIFEPSRATAN